MSATWDLADARLRAQTEYRAAVAAHRGDTATLAVAQAEYRANYNAITAAWVAGRPDPTVAASASTAAPADIATTPAAAPATAGALTYTGLTAGRGLVLAHQSWGVQSGTPDGVSVGSDGSLRFRASAGERADFDEPRKIRAEVAGSRLYAKGEPITLKGRLLVDPASRIAGADWCSVVQIHQADTRRETDAPVLASPLFTAELGLDARGAPFLQVRGETGTGLQPTFSPVRVLGRAPFAFGREHAFDMLVVDGHGGPGRIRVALDGRTVCDFTGPTGTSTSTS